jgi:hypothetical protein
MQNRSAQSLHSGVAAAAGFGLAADETRAAADAAMDNLRRAVAAGWRDVAGARKDPDLDPIRGRRDFQLLMMDVAFPTRPLIGSD